MNVNKNDEVKYLDRLNLIHLITLSNDLKFDIMNCDDNLLCKHYISAYNHLNDYIIDRLIKEKESLKSE